MTATATNQTSGATSTTATVVPAKPTPAKRGEVTQAMLDKCQRYVEKDGTITGQQGKVFYIVQSRSTDGQEYHVEWNAQCKSLSCTCPAGNPDLDQYGIPMWLPSDCWHRRAAMKDAELYRVEQAIRRDYEEKCYRMERLQLLGLTMEEADTAVTEAHLWRVNLRPIDDETLARVYGARRYPTEAEANA